MYADTNAASLSKVRIAVVDDNRNFLHVMHSVLRSLGIKEIFETVSAYQLLEHLRRHGIDLLIVDYMMPEINGIELISMIRNDRRLVARSVPIICISGYSERSTVEAALRAGADGFLVKPVRAVDVYRQVAYLIEHPIQCIDANGNYNPNRWRNLDDAGEGPEQRSEIVEI